jgi:O-methyltransferase domain
MNLNQDSQATSVIDAQFDDAAEDRRCSSSTSDRRPVEPNWILDDSIPAPIRVLQLATGRWVAHVVGVAAELTQHAAEMQIFAQAMNSFSAQIGAAVADAYDFSEILTLADIGGSHGMVLALILADNPAMRGILFDLPGVIEGSSDFLKSRGMQQRIDLKGGNFFDSVPQGADAYLLKHVLHDWSDENCLRILKNIYAAAKQATKLPLVEFILNEPDEPQFAKVSDLEMLVNSPHGRERTRVDWQKLQASLRDELKTG